MLDPTETPEVKAALVETDQLATSLETYAVRSAEDYEGGGEFLKRIKAAQAKLETLRTGITGPMNSALKRVNDLFRTPAEKLIAAERTVKRALVVYSDEQERIQREAQARADAEARREAKRLQDIADETKRKADAEAAEIRRQEEEVRRKAEADAAAARKAEDDARRAGDAEAARAIAAKAAADKAAADEEAARLATKAAKVDERAEAKADQFTERAASTVAPTVAAAAPPKVAGVNTRSVWKFKVVDPTKVAPAFMIPDEKAIGGTVRSMKGNARTVLGEGVKVWEEREIAASSAA